MLLFDQLKKNDPHLRILTFGVLAGMAILLLGLYFVQVIASRNYVADQKAQSFRTVRIPAVRGKILDRHGRPLAENKPSYNVCLYLDELRHKFTYQYTNVVLPAYRRENPTQKRVPRSRQYELMKVARYQAASNIVERLALSLQEQLTLEARDFHRHYESTLALPMPVIFSLTANQLARFQENPETAAGVDLEIQPNRFYPHAQTAAHVLGYLTRDNRSTVGEDAFVNYRMPDYSGSVGIEWSFDQNLRGKGGVKSVLVNSLGYRQAENVWTPAEPGRNVVLTLDLEIQQTAEKALQSVGPDPRGAVVVMDPQSGDILALVSAPDYDPNQFIPKISQNDYDRLLDEDRKPLVNRAIQMNYAPGSIFKIVTGLACLEAGLDPKAIINNPGHIYVGRKFDDLAQAGPYDFRRAFMESSNTYFITNALLAGIERIIRIGQQLHLGEATGIPTRQEVPGHFPSLKDVRKGWFAGDTANISIGQGPIDITPLQIAVMISAIANGGKVLWPRLISRVESQDPNSEEAPMEFSPGRVRSKLDVRPQSLEITRQAMLADVEDEHGTGRKAGVPGLRVCGKTGTAQITNMGGKVVGHTTWFASYAPFEKPRYVVVVMVENGQSGGSTCAPVAQKIYKALLEQEQRVPANSQTMAQIP